MGKKIITISRQCGSGGHTIGKMVAEKLNVPFYDKQILKIVAERSGLAQEVIEEKGEYNPSSLLYMIATKLSYGYSVGSKGEMPLPDQINAFQTELIRELAEKESCVIIGRDADYILREHPDCFHVFIHGKLDDRMKRVVTEHGVAPDEARHHVQNRVIQGFRPERRFMMLVMPIDTGNKAIKTEHFEFHSGISVLEDVPGEGEEAIKYQGRYYRLSPERNVYLPDKAVDERYYILTLFAVAKELREMKPPRLFLQDEAVEIDLLVGLPPLYYRGQYKKFREYFFRSGQMVDFEYMGIAYRISFSEVYVHMQTYAAYLYVAKELNLFRKKVLLLDIGGFTLDYMLLEKGMI